MKWRTYFPLLFELTVYAHLTPRMQADFSGRL